jgi:hypothetical protein
VKRSTLVLMLTLGCLITGAQSRADVNVLIIGSTRDSGEMHPANVWWSAQKPPQVPNSKPFLPAEIGTQLQNILAQDGRGTVNVTVQERYASHAITNGWYAHSYNLATWFHYPYPAGAESNRWANLRGEAGTNWNYVVLIGDPYTMEYTPGMYAHGVAKVAEEVAKGGAETVLLMPWPGSGSSSTINHYKEVVYRTGRSGGFKVAPAGLAWQASGLSNSGANPNTHGAYIAASSIYSCIYTQSAKASAYVYNDGYADTAYNTFTNNNTASHYTGTFSFQNPYRILDDKMRHVRMSERGTSTEEGFKGKIRTALTRSAVTYAEYNDSYTNNTPTATVWTTNPMPISFNYGRDGFYSEPEKSYVINPSYWQLGFGYYYQSGGSYPVETLNDMHIGLMQEQDNDLANRMIKEGSTARNIPTRSLWAQIHKAYPTLSPMRDTTHLSYNLDEAVGTYIYTIYSGRCPLDPKPATDDIVWTSRRIGYETAWRLGRCQSRAPGFKVMPSTAAKNTIIPGENETMTVQFILPPQQDITVNVSISNAAAAIVGPATLVFTPENYSTPQNVTIAGIQGGAASESFNVVFETSSNDEVYDGLSDSWAYTINRSAPQSVSAVDKGTVLTTAYKDIPKTITLNTAGANSANTRFAGPNNGALSWSGADVIYAPNAGFAGKDGFAFAVLDNGVLSTGVIEIDVLDQAPVGTVAYNGNGNTGGSAPFDSNTYSENDTVTVLGNIGGLVKTGHSFSGWNTASDGSGSGYAGGSTFTMGSAGVLLFAQWLPDTYTINYAANNATSGTVPAAQTKTFGVDLVLSGNTGGLARTGFNFVGWNTVADGSGQSFAAGASFTLEQSATLYAQWNAPPVVDAGTSQSIALSGSVAWTPAEIATHAWYDANDATTIVASAGSVSIWKDKSGYHRDATQANEAKMPTTSTRTIGGLNALDFAATQDLVVPSFDFIGKECWTVINKDTADDFHVLGSSANVQVGVLSTGKMRIWPAYATETQSTTLISVGSDYVLGFRALNPKKYSINGIEEITANVPNNILTITRIMENQYAHNSDGLIGEIVVTAGELSTDDRQRMEGYLAHKWGQAGKLPGDHLYKDVAPGGPTAVANLHGMASDPEGDPITTLWSVFSGPADVTFDDPTALQTTATFTQAGTYVLRLTADDSFNQVVDDVVITVGALSAAYVNWLIQHFGEGAVDDMALASNGVYTIRQSYIAGLDPTNLTARFLIEDLGRDTASQVLQWSGVTGRLYSVYWSSNLLHGGGFELIGSNIPWNANSFTDAVQRASGQGFYRIGVQYEE